MMFAVSYMSEISGNMLWEIPIIFGHGFPFTNQMWKPLFDCLKNNTDVFKRHSLLAPDFYGLGRSDIAPYTKTMVMSEMVHCIFALAERYNAEKFIYCGLSMGGYVGWELWRQAPNRLLGLIVSDSNAKADSPEAAANRLKTADRVEKENSCAFLADAMLPNLFSPETIEKRPEVIKLYRDMVCNNNPQGVAAAARGMAQRADYTARLGEIKTPTLVIGGEHDKLSPPEALDALAAAMPNAKRATIPSAGHLAPMENPEAYAKAIAEFVKDLRCPRYF